MLHIIDLQDKNVVLRDYSEKKEIFVNFKDFEGKEISYKRICIGYDVGGRYEPCPERKEVKNDYQCQKCKERDFFRGCAKCNGFSCKAKNEKAKEWCNMKHYVYLVYFGGKEAKVGVANEKRKYLRVKEQGALAYAFIAECKNGMFARQLEFLIKKKFNIPDRVSLTRKVYLYRQGFFFEDFYDFVSSIVERLNSTGKWKILRDFEFSEIKENLRFAEEVRNSIVSLTKVVRTFDGELKIAGRIWGLKRGNHMVIFKFDNIRGYFLL